MKERTKKAEINVFLKKILIELQQEFNILYNINVTKTNKNIKNSNIDEIYIKEINDINNSLKIIKNDENNNIVSFGNFPNIAI